MTYSPEMKRLPKSQLVDAVETLERVLEKSNDPEASVFKAQLRHWTSDYIAGYMRKDVLMQLIAARTNELS